MAVLGTWTPEDGLLGAVAPVALAMAAGTALVVDLDPHGPHYRGGATLADLVAEGPRGSDLRPRHAGVAVLRNGGVEPDDARSLLAEIEKGWPAVVYRHPPRPDPPDGVGVVPVHLLAPGGALARTGRAVYQRCGWRVAVPPEGVVLPRPRSGTVKAILEGRSPAPDRWLRSWRTVWSSPWR